MTCERRAYVVWLTPEAVLALFQWRSFDRIRLPELTAGRGLRGERVEIPGDVKIMGATYDWARAAIGLRLEHSSFPSVPDGAECPTLQLTELTITGLKAAERLDGGLEVTQDESADIPHTTTPRRGREFF